MGAVFLYYGTHRLSFDKGKKLTLFLVGHISTLKEKGIMTLFPICTVTHEGFFMLQHLAI